MKKKSINISIKYNNKKKTTQLLSLILIIKIEKTFLRLYILIITKRDIIQVATLTNINQIQKSVIC